MSEFADIFSESRKLTEKEKKLLQQGVDFTYDRFTGKVIESRKINRDEIPRVAEGRVFTGLQAGTRSLVDEKGGLIAAIEYARFIAHIDRDFTIVKYPDERGPLIQLFRAPELQILYDQFRNVLQGIDYIKLKFFSNNLFYNYFRQMIPNFIRTKRGI